MLLSPHWSLIEFLCVPCWKSDHIHNSSSRGPSWPHLKKQFVDLTLFHLGENRRLPTTEEMLTEVLHYASEAFSKYTEHAKCVSSPCLVLNQSITPYYSFISFVTQNSLVNIMNIIAEVCSFSITKHDCFWTLPLSVTDLTKLSLHFKVSMK